MAMQQGDERGSSMFSSLHYSSGHSIQMQQQEQPKLADFFGGHYNCSSSGQRSSQGTAHLAFFDLINMNQLPGFVSTSGPLATSTTATASLQSSYHPSMSRGFEVGGGDAVHHDFREMMLAGLSVQPEQHQAQLSSPSLLFHDSRHQIDHSAQQQHSVMNMATLKSLLRQQQQDKSQEEEHFALASSTDQFERGSSAMFSSLLHSSGHSIEMQRQEQPKLADFFGGHYNCSSSSQGTAHLAFFDLIQLPGFVSTSGPLATSSTATASLQSSYHPFMSRGFEVGGGDAVHHDFAGSLSVQQHQAQLSSPSLLFHDSRHQTDHSAQQQHSVMNMATLKSLLRQQQQQQLALASSIDQVNNHLQSLALTMSPGSQSSGADSSIAHHEY